MDQIIMWLLRPFWEIHRYFADMGFHLSSEKRRFMSEVRWKSKKKGGEK